MSDLARIETKIVHEGDHNKYGACEVCGKHSYTVWRGTVWVGRYEPDGVFKRLALDVFGCLECVNRLIALQVKSTI